MARRCWVRCRQGRQRRGSEVGEGQTVVSVVMSGKVPLAAHHVIVKVFPVGSLSSQQPPDKAEDESKTDNTTDYTSCNGSRCIISPILRLKRKMGKKRGEREKDSLFDPPPPPLPTGTLLVMAIGAEDVSMVPSARVMVVTLDVSNEQQRMMQGEIITHT